MLLGGRRDETIGVQLLGAIREVLAGRGENADRIKSETWTTNAVAHTIKQDIEELFDVVHAERRSALSVRGAACSAAAST